MAKKEKKLNVKDVAKKQVVENVKAHYWLICSMIKLETFELAKNQIMVARKLLTSDEYTSLKKLIFQDDTIPYNSFFDVE